MSSKISDKPNTSVTYPNKECSVCKKTVEKILKCSACHVTPYCGRDCQRSDWKKHKPNCVNLGTQKIEELSQQGNNLILDMVTQFNNLFGKVNQQLSNVKKKFDNGAVGLEAYSGASLGCEIDGKTLIQGLNVCNKLEKKTKRIKKLTKNVANQKQKLSQDKTESKKDT